MKIEFLYSLGAAFVSLIFLMLVFLPMEKMFPARKNQKILRPKWMVDLCFYLGQYLIFSALVLWLLFHFKYHLQGILPIEIKKLIGSQYFIFQAIEALILSDLLIYWGHRLQHKYNFLWRFHKVHHSAEHLDWLAAHREHPIDSIYTIGLINFPAFILGFPLEAISGVIAFRGIWAIYIHSNVRLPIGPIRKLIGAPELHHWHHSLERFSGNYANISPLMDIAFGTYICPDKEPQRFGIKEKTPNTYLGQLIEPIAPKSYWRIVNKRNHKIK